jgi:hypothetical protein
MPGGIACTRPMRSRLLTIVIPEIRPERRSARPRRPPKCRVGATPCPFNPARNLPDRLQRLRIRRAAYTPDATATMPEEAFGRETCLYGIYFVDIHLYGAVTSMKFPVWLQDGKWPPEGKLSSSSISPRGFLFFAADEVVDLLCPGRERPAWRAGLFCVLDGAVVCLAIVGRGSRAAALPPATNSAFLRPCAALTT